MRGRAQLRSAFVDMTDLVRKTGKTTVCGDIPSEHHTLRETRICSHPNIFTYSSMTSMTQHFNLERPQLEWGSRKGSTLSLQFAGDFSAAAVSATFISPILTAIDR